MNILCLTFVALTQAGNPPPAHIQKLIESRIQKQWTSHRADVTLDFENSECSHKGEYRYDDQSITLQADSDIWKGRLEIQIEDVLSGRKIDFSNVAHALNYEAPTTSRKNSSFKKWLPWGLALVGLGTSAWLIHERNQHVKKLQGLKINF